MWYTHTNKSFISSKMVVGSGSEWGSARQGVGLQSTYGGLLPSKTEIGNEGTHPKSSLRRLLSVRDRAGLQNKCLSQKRSGGQEEGERRKKRKKRREEKGKKGWGGEKGKREEGKEEGEAVIGSRCNSRWKSFESP